MGPSFDSQQTILTVLDTGARPNFVLADFLPLQLIDELDQNHEIVNLASAYKHRFEVLDIFPLIVTVASNTVRIPFFSMRQLSTDFILVCHYMDKECKQSSSSRDISSSWKNHA